MNYKEFKTFDFLKDDFFVQWVTKPDMELNLFWESWLRNNPDKADEIAQARDFINSIDLKNRYQIKENLYNEMFEQVLQFKQQLEDREKHKLQYRSGLKHGWYVAASFILIALLGGIFWLKSSSFIGEEDFQKELMISKATPKGAKLTITLEDGSMVKLNSNSKLNYPLKFNDTTRWVELKGEAWFDVNPDADRPFIVKSEYFDTEVLGTSFTMRTYPNEDKYIAVASGRVKVKHQMGAEKIINTYEMGQWDPNLHLFVTKAFDFKKVLGWKDGIIIFDKANFNEVVATLSDWFGIEFSIGAITSFDGLYSGEFRNETLENILEGLSFSYDFEYTINNNVVTIY